MFSYMLVLVLINNHFQKIEAWFQFLQWNIEMTKITEMQKILNCKIVAGTEKKELS